jgi:Protein of unknown function (DUF1402)
MYKRHPLRQPLLIGCAILLPLLLPTIAHFSAPVDGDYRQALEFWRQNTPQPTIEESTKDITRYRVPILEASATFQVDPVVIAGIIFAEETLNRNPTKYFEDYYVRRYLLSLSDDELRRQLQQTKEELQQAKEQGHEGWNISFRSGHPLAWSIGLGRVSLLTALELEDELHLYEHRSRRDIRGVLSALLEPRQNLRYCAFELRRDRAIYLDITGYDISGRPDLEASLYNLGHVQAVAERTVRENRRPTANLFGEYVLSHAREVRAALYGGVEQKSLSTASSRQQ